MNFFRAQEQARQQTFWLVGLFVMAVTALVLLTLAVVAAFVWHSDPGLWAGRAGTPPEQGGLLAMLSWSLQGLGAERITAIVVLVVGTILCGIAFRWFSLREGGRVIAEAMGGTRLSGDDPDYRAQRLRNVVEEMALAAGMAVPPVYVLRDERGINAFAAGLNQRDAVIALSQGCLDQLNREQLQGVVAHEISHILNGDMRLNMQMIAVLHGITMISEAGRVLMDVGSRRARWVSGRNKNNGLAAFFLMGLCLLVLGSIGQLFGHVIRAAVSRQREFLADASAVQFTRNPHGIGGALRVIAGHAHHGYLGNRRAQEYSHLFLVSGLRSQWFASHPPLDDRIRRIIPDWAGDSLAPEPLAAEEHAAVARFATSATNSAPPLEPIAYEPVSVVSNSAGAFTYDANMLITPNAVAENEAHVCVTQYQLQLDATLEALVHQSFGSVSILLALLLDEASDTRVEQCRWLEEHEPRWYAGVLQAEKALRGIAETGHIALLELLMPALKSLSTAQYKRLREVMAALIKQDATIQMREWLLYEWVRQHGDRFFGLSHPPRPKYRRASQLVGHFNIVLHRLLSCQPDESEGERELRHAQAIAIAGLEETIPMPKVQGDHSEQHTDFSKEFARAVFEMGRAYPLLKPRFLKALVFAARADGRVCAQEQQMVSVIALIWDCPLIGLDVAFDQVA